MNRGQRQAPDLTFWLRSIDDLDQEYRRGELDEAAYVHLRDDHVAQAADQLRNQRDDQRATSAPPARQRRVRNAALAAVSTLAVVTIVALAVIPTWTRDRGSGDTITGNAAVTAARPTVADLRAAAARNPDDPTAQLQLARALLETNQLVDALTTYDAAEQLDPTNAEPAAYRAWIVLLAGLAEESVAEADRANAIDPDYPDAHLILSLALRERGETSAAREAVQRFIELTDESHPMRPMADALAAELAG